MKTTKELIIADITAKVEAKLASQKVELGRIDDFFRITDGIRKRALAAQKQAVDALEKAQEEVQLISIVQDQSNSMLKMYNELDKLYKELGVEMPKNVISEYEEISKIRALSIPNLVGRVDTVLKDITKIKLL